MSSYEVSFYTRDDLTFGRDDDGNFTVTVNTGATPDSIKIVDNDKDGEDTFSGSTKAGPTDQQAYGESDGTTFEGDPIQPLAALPGQDDSEMQILAIGVGDPVHTVGYGFNYTPVQGETVSFDYDGYISEPSCASEDLYAKGQSDDQDSEDDSEDDDSSSSSAEEGGSSPFGKASGTSEASGGGSGGSTPSGTSGPSGGSSDSSSPPCFTRGTAILTARGEVVVEELVIGDMVWTEAHGMQPLRWVFQREVIAKGAFAPIRICAGALGADCDILVSPAHRMLVSGLEIELLFGLQKALVAAKDLVNDHSIFRETTLEAVEYFHLLFDQHEVLQAHGTLSESFYPTAETIGDFGIEQRAELHMLFPELEFGCQNYGSIYPSLKAYEIQLVSHRLM